MPLVYVPPASTDIPYLIETALFTTLSADQGIQYVVGTNIFNNIAPAATTVPYIVYTYMGGGDTLETPRQNMAVRYQVACFATNALSAQQGCDRIQALLERKKLIIPLWENYFAERKMWLRDTIVEQKAIWYRRGAVYEFWLDWTG